MNEYFCGKISVITFYYIPMDFMKTISASVLLLASGLLAVAQQEPVELTLDQCLRIALDSNPTVKVADIEIQRVDYSKREVIGQLLPSVDFGGTYSRMLAKQVMYMDMDFGSLLPGESDQDTQSRAGSSGKGEGIKMGRDNSYSLGFQASLPLIAPQLWQSIGLTDTQIARSVEVARQSRQNLVNQVKNAYYALMLAQNSRQVIEESYAMAALTHQTYTRQFEAGAASDYDVLRTSVAMRNIEPELLQSEIAIKQARLQLLILMGVDAHMEIMPNDSLSRYEASMYETTLNAARDFGNNSELRIMNLDTDLAERNIRIQKLAYCPTLALTANYNWTSMSNGSPFKNFRWNPYSTIGLSLNVPIFSGGQRFSKVKQAQLQHAELQLQRTNLERNLAMQVDLAIDNINLNVRQIASCAESVNQAVRAHDIMVASFDIGAASYLDLRDSELALTRSRLAYLQAIYNYLVAHSNLELLRGDADIAAYQAQ